MEITKLKLFPNLAHEHTILKVKVAWGEHFSNIQQFRGLKECFKNTLCNTQYHTENRQSFGLSNVRQRLKIINDSKNRTVHNLHWAKQQNWDIFVRAAQILICELIYIHVYLLGIGLKGLSPSINLYLYVYLLQVFKEILSGFQTRIPKPNFLIKYLT